MYNKLVKVRLSNCRKIKPLWIKSEDLRNATNDVSRFMLNFISKNANHCFDRHHLIYFNQIPAWRVPGFEHKTYVKNSPTIKKIRKFDKHYGKYNYITNTKVDYWASFGIHPVPSIKIISNEHKLKDPSGINPIDIYTMKKILVRNCYGVFYENTLNYAKNIDHWDINFNTNIISENGEQTYWESVSIVQFLETIFSSYCAAKNHTYLIGKVMNLMSNSTFGKLVNMITCYYSISDEYIQMMKNPEFGKVIIDGKSSDTNAECHKVITLYLNIQNPIIDEIEKFVDEYKLTADDTVNITFETNFIYKER